MKKITFTLAVILAMYSCKTETKKSETIKIEPAQVELNQPVADTAFTPVSPVLNPAAVVPPGFYKNNGLYDGYGVVDSTETMNYNVLMPLLKSGSYSFVEFYNLGNNVLFLQMQDPDFEPTSKNSIYTLNQNIESLGFRPNTDISVFLYFENGEKLTRAKAEVIYAEGCNGMSEPKKCGTGILKFSDR